MKINMIFVLLIVSMCPNIYMDVEIMNPHELLNIDWAHLFEGQGINAAYVVVFSH